MRDKLVVRATLLAFLVTQVLVTAPAHGDEQAVARFEAFASMVGPVCASAASTACFELAFRLADGDRSGGLSLREVEQIRDDLVMWLAARGSTLTMAERTYVALGVRIVDLVGLEQLHASYDVDGDGEVDRAELQADIVLDERPLGQVVTDGDAVDWQGVQARLGALGTALLPR